MKITILFISLIIRFAQFLVQKNAKKCAVHLVHKMKITFSFLLSFLFITNLHIFGLIFLLSFKMRNLHYFLMFLLSLSTYYFPKIKNAKFDFKKHTFCVFFCFHFLHFFKKYLFFNGKNMKITKICVYLKFVKIKLGETHKLCVFFLNRSPFFIFFQIFLIIKLLIIKKLNQYVKLITRSTYSSV